MNLLDWNVNEREFKREKVQMNPPIITAINLMLQNTTIHKGWTVFGKTEKYIEYILIFGLDLIRL